MLLLGQICGIFSAIITLLQPQFRKKSHISLCCVAINALNTLNFLLLGQRGASVYLCLVAVAQGLLSVLHEEKGTRASHWETWIFCLLYLIFGSMGLDWREPVEFLPLVGAWMLMLSVFARSPQRTRLFLLLNSGVWLVYTGLHGSTVFFSSLIALISTTIALIRNR